MIEKLTPSQLNEYYNRVSENGIHGLKGIEYFQAKQLLEYCQSKELKNQELCYNFFTSNPEYNYPEKYKGGRELEYWSTTVADYNLPSYVITIVEKFLTTPTVNDNSEKIKKPKPQELSLRQIALIHVYNRLSITRENSDKIAKQHNHNSGENLYQKFTYYSKKANRKGRPTPCTPKKLSNKIELFESITPHLKATEKQEAIDEINILKSIYESEYQ